MIDATISNPMTWKEICEQYPCKWVALVEIDWVNETDFDFRSARVVGHGNRREQYEQARAWSSRYTSMGHFYTGRVRAAAGAAITVPRYSPSTRGSIVTRSQLRSPPLHVGHHECDLRPKI